MWISKGVKTDQNRPKLTKSLMGSDCGGGGGVVGQRRVVVRRELRGERALGWGGGWGARGNVTYLL